MDKGKSARISKITSQFLSNRYSAATEEKIQKWLIEEKDSDEKEKSSLVYWNSLEVKADKATYRALKRARTKAGFTDNPKMIKMYRNLARVAAVLLPFILAAGIFYYSHTAKENIVEIHVPYGIKRQLILSDGSVVSLNSGTTLRYPEKFTGNSRIVNLIGEAYFTVSKNVSKPFIVKTNHLSVKVLGTQFNVKAYPDDDRTIATLNSGKIEVNTNSRKSSILEPNQQLSYVNNTSQMLIRNVFAEESIGWTSGQLIFDHSTFDEILRTLERHFNISFIADSNLAPSDEYYTIKFLKNDNLGQILSVLKDVVGNFSFQKQGNQILLKKI